MEALMMMSKGTSALESYMSKHVENFEEDFNNSQKSTSDNSKSSESLRELIQKDFREELETAAMNVTDQSGLRTLHKRNNDISTFSSISSDKHNACYFSVKENNKKRTISQMCDNTQQYLPPSPAASSSSSVIGALNPTTTLWAAVRQSVTTPGTFSSSDQQSPQSNFVADMGIKYKETQVDNQTKMSRKRKKRKKRISRNTKTKSSLKKILVNTILNANRSGIFINEKEKVTELIETLVRKMKENNFNRTSHKTNNEVSLYLL